MMMVGIVDCNFQNCLRENNHNVAGKVQKNSGTFRGFHGNILKSLK